MMSLANAKAFLQRMQLDPQFKQRLVAAPGTDARARILAAEGYEFTSEEVRQLRQELVDEPSARPPEGGQRCFGGKGVA